MQLNIPFFSQLDTKIPEELRRSVCAIACLKMILDYKNSPQDFMTILKESEWIGHKDARGWTHEVLVRVLRNHNVLAYRQEFIGHSINVETASASVAEHTTLLIEQGISKIKKSIDAQNPVMVSVTAGFSQNQSDHVVLVVGYDDNNFFVLDPILSQEQNPMKVPVDTFKTFWKSYKSNLLR
jgi:uncharacterized protein YvpB